MRDLSQRSIELKLKASFDYNAETGIIRRKKNRKIVGTNNGRYSVIGFDYKIYYAHRLAWLLYYGEWPTKEIDHINGDRLDNRIVNLRSASRQQNAFNRPKQANNTSGTTGVNWCKKAKVWRAFIYSGGAIHLGSFKNKDDAIKAREAKIKELHGEFASVRG